MAVGQSGGRSAGNKQSGDRRATQRERAAIDPPGRSDWERLKTEDEPWVLTGRGEKVFAILAAGTWVFFCTFMAIVFAEWWGVL